MGIQQAAIPATPYRDQVLQAGLDVKLEEGPTESPVAGINQKPGESLPKFIDRVQISLNQKLPPDWLKDEFRKLIVWEG